MILWLHLLGATIWVGGHLILAFVFLPAAFKSRDLELLKQFESKFEKIGIPALVVQVVTGVVLAFERVPDVSQWVNVTTPGIRVVPFKLLALLLTLILAIHARIWIWPKLTLQKLPLFCAHVILVTILAIIFMTLGLGFRLGWI